MLGRSYGFSADHVRSLEVVTADGEIRHASDREHPELFWAVRGGKGNFGIVTSITTGLMRLSRIYGGGMIFPGEKTRRGASHVDRVDLVAAGSHELVGCARSIPGRARNTEPLRGQFVVHLRIAFTGSARRGRDIGAPTTR